MILNFNYRNYMGKLLVVSTLIALPAFDGIPRIVNNGTTYYEPLYSLDYLILSQAGKLFNCSFIFKAPDDGQWS